MDGFSSFRRFSNSWQMPSHAADTVSKSVQARLEVCAVVCTSTMQCTAGSARGAMRTCGVTRIGDGAGKTAAAPHV